MNATSTHTAQHISELVYIRSASDLQSVVTVRLEGNEIVRRDVSGVRRSAANLTNILREAELCATDSSLDLGARGMKWAAKFLETLN